MDYLGVLRELADRVGRGFGLSLTVDEIPGNHSQSIEIIANGDEVVYSGSKAVASAALAFVLKLSDLSTEYARADPL